MTAKSVAWPSRPLEQRFGRSQGASTGIDVAPGDGEAEYLNVPAWLWPELTMHLTSVTDGGMSSSRTGLLAQIPGNGEVTCCGRPRRRPTAPEGARLQLWLAITQARSRQGFPYGRA